MDVLIAAVLAAAPLTAASGFTGADRQWRFWELTIDLAKAELVLVDKDGGGDLEDMIPKDAWAALNGGYWLANYKPTGWAKDERREIGKRKSPGAVGVVAIENGEVYAGPIAKLPLKKPSFAIQNSPVLVHPDGKIGIKKDDGKKNARTVACVNDKKLRFVIIQGTPKTGPTLMETAKLMKQDFACKSALNLDGGPSTGLWLKKEMKTDFILPAVPIGYGIAVMQRR